MSNDAKADLIYAILTLDSYNRGYGKGISGPDVSTASQTTRIGNYTIDKKNASYVFSDAAFDAGFYAIVYRMGDETVIAYRGTNAKGLSASATMGGSDVLNGYGLALGLTPDSTINVATRQAALAAQFSTSVTGNRSSQPRGSPNTIA